MKRNKRLDLRTALRHDSRLLYGSALRMLFRGDIKGVVVSFRALLPRGVQFGVSVVLTEGMVVSRWGS